MSSATEAPEPPAGRGRLFPILVGAAIFMAGAGGGVTLGAVFKDRETPQAQPAEAGAGSENRQEIEVGRITVVIPADRPEGGRLHLLVAPLVVAYPVADDGAKSEKPHVPTAELRDAFIEYLSQLRENDIRGSAGFALLREELLRRARAVAPELNATAVLIQDLVIQ